MPLPGAGRTVPAGDLFAVARRCARTGGAGTGRPGMAARAVGLTPGCGVTCAFASCSGLSFTISRATGLPLPKASERTAVVAMSTSWPSYVPTLIRSSWISASASRSADSSASRTWSSRSLSRAARSAGRSRDRRASCSASWARASAWAAAAAASAAAGASPESRPARSSASAAAFSAHSVEFQEATWASRRAFVRILKSDVLPTCGRPMMPVFTPPQPETGAR